MADRLGELQIAISLIQQDTEQVVDRAVRSNDMQLLPSFTGENKYLELTRDGLLNPGSLEKRSNLQRVALQCANGQLLRITWPTLDSVDKNKHQTRVLLDQVANCHFSYLNKSLQFLNDWQAHAVSQDQRKEPLPKAIQLQLTLEDWGEMNMIFPIPGADYAKK
jgi:general secretion pathway protein J